ncbi:MAG: hypothetical protein GY796_11655 [Chloroflexi bacterium]|nr:hypothetical protein [Chloroflexota bacterium]
MLENPHTGQKHAFRTLTETMTFLQRQMGLDDGQKPLSCAGCDDNNQDVM